MPLSPDVKQELLRTARDRKPRLIEIVRELVRMPSENTPPLGAEELCQTWLAEQLKNLDLAVDVYDPAGAPGLTDHAFFHSGRSYAGRPNVGARSKGTGGGRSLLLSGHIDTVPRGTQHWTRDPFGAQMEDNRIYGRGANDMKAGVAMNLFVTECLAEFGRPLQGDLIFESVVDEEFGGCVGTLAGRLCGYVADAAVITEPSRLRICPAQRGGRTAQVELRGRREGVLDTKDGFPKGAVPQLTYLLGRLIEFAEQRRSRCTLHEMYAGDPDPVPVSVTKVYTSPWGFHEPLTVPETARVEIYWQMMPGERQGAIEHEFLSWIDSIVASKPELFVHKPDVVFPIGWLPGSAISASEPLVTELSACAEQVLGSKPRIAGIEGPCDLFIFHEFGIPAVLWGPSGGNIHAGDEFVEIDSLVSAAHALLLFTAHWCGIEN